MAAPKLAISLQWTQLAMSDILTIISGTGTITQSMLMKDIGTDMRLIDQKIISFTSIFIVNFQLITIYYDFVQVNPEMVDTLEKSGLKFVGKDETGKRMEASSLLCSHLLSFTFENL